MTDLSPSSPHALPHDPRPLFAYVLNHEIRSVLDDDGRPVGEQRAPALYEATPTELKRCPYPGSRNHHERPMNLSALRQMTQSWPQILVALAGWQRKYAERTPRTSYDYFDLWKVCFQASALPVYWMYENAPRTPDARVPVFASAVYKVLLGIVGVAGELAMMESLRKRHLLVRLSHRGPLYAFSPSAFHEYVEVKQQLIGAKEVCAGPKKLIEEAMKSLMLGEANGAFPAHPFEGLIEDADRFYEFVDEAARLAMAHFAYVLSTRKLLAPAPSGWRPGGGEGRAQLRAAWQRMLEAQRGDTVEACKALDGVPPRYVRTVIATLAEREPALADLTSLWPERANDAETDALTTALCARADSHLAWAGRSPCARRRNVRVVASALLRYAQWEAGYVRLLAGISTRLESLGGRVKAASIDGASLVEVTGGTPARVFEELVPTLKILTSSTGARLEMEGWALDLP